MPDLINMRLHELQPVYYAQPENFERAAFWMAVALDERLFSPDAAERYEREAIKFYQSARAYAPCPTGSVNVRANVIDVLRRIGGAQ